MSSALQTTKQAVHSVPAGFPAAANESSHEQVSLDSYLVSNPASTVDVSARGFISWVSNSGFLAVSSLSICSSDMLTYVFKFSQITKTVYKTIFIRNN